jgi:3-hydroxyisobutyrate dehydrogenase-like beta-hydroxyacid dehydrogenase
VKVGFIGLGQMGSGMVLALRGRGGLDFDVVAMLQEERVQQKLELTEEVTA